MAHNATNPHASTTRTQWLDDLRRQYLAASGSPAEPVDFVGGGIAPGALDLDLLPPVIAALARDAAASIGSTPDATALTALAAAAGATRSGWRIETRTGYAQPAILWTGIVGAPGGGKSSHYNAGAAPLWTIEQEWAPASAEARHMWKVRKASFEAAFAKAKAGKGSYPSADDDPGECPGDRLIALGNTTIEAAGKAAADNPAGILLARDELSAWVQSMGRYASGGGDGERAEWLESWNGRPGKITRKGAPTLHLANWGVSVAGGIQPDRLAAAYTGGEDGFIDRFLFVSVPRRTGTVPGYAPNLTARADWERRLRGIANAGAGDVVRLSDEAQAVFERMDRLAVEQGQDRDRPMSWRGAMAKAPAQWLRLALVLFVVERVGDASGELILTGEQAEVAERLWLDWLAPSVSAIHLSVLNRITDRRTGGDLGAIAAWIVQHGRGTLRWEEVRQGVRALRGFNAQDGAGLMAQMTDNGWLSPVRRQGNRTWWIVNPRVFEVFRDERGNSAGRAIPPAPDAAPDRETTRREPPTQTPAQAVPVDEPSIAEWSRTVRAEMAQAGAEAPGQGSTVADWRREIGPDCEPDCEPDDDPAARDAFYAAMLSDCAGRA